MKPAQQQSSDDDRNLLRGMAWIGSARWVAQGLSWTATLFVVRLVAPIDYGIATLALAIFAILAVVAEFAIGTAVITKQDLSDGQVSQLHSVAVGLSMLMAVVMLVAAPIAAVAFFDSRLVDALRVLSVAVLAEGVRAVPVALITKRLNYRLLAAVEFVKQVGTSLTVLVLALSGAGMWALVIGYVVGAAAATALVLHRCPLGFVQPHFQEIRQSLRFAFEVVTARLAWMTYKNSDFFVVGRLYPGELLGQYTMAWTIASLPGEKLGNVITAASQPFFASIQSSLQKLTLHFCRITQLLAFLLFPMVFGLAVVADLVVKVVLGPQWLASVHTMQLLLAFSAVSSVFAPVGQILQVTNNARTSMRVAIATLVVLPAAFAFAGTLAGIVGVAVAWLVVYPALYSVCVITALRALDLRLSQYLTMFVPPVISTAFMVLCVSLMRTRLGFQNNAIELTISILCGAVAYAAIMALCFRRFALEIYRWIKQ